ncbi:outer membrane beta-barrel protein [Confluentibacter flavum]|uniref:tRNA modification GTPase n=1 Tax=Confluentibacter flavum TaxID=1909700 RepID=A0A2N3HMB4_9FLAO|nr:outer membrane beta-barrel protein [Confluentibacter flavum]PKQ46120.1 tRNA modification GTPase [Confluentibacter flavum]
MKKQLLSLLITLLAFNLHAQISFEKGYYIDDTDQKINCLIKNMDWKDSPTDIEYKLSENDNPKTATIESIKEFGIDQASKYIRETVNIDMSTNNLNNLEKGKEPIFSEKQLFLKVLIEGKANLYLYEEGNLKRFFYMVDNSNIEQLVYKIYLTESNKTKRNKQFKQQLWNALKCPTITMSDVENVKYEKNNLINFFGRYNSCHDSNFTSYEEKVERDVFNLTLRPRFNNSSLSIKNENSNNYNLNFGSKTSFGFGAEVEFILPFNKNKWAITIEPTYQKFKAEKTTDASNVSGGKLTANLEYNSIEIPLGVKHYFYLSDHSKIFANISYVMDFSSKTTIDFKRADGSELNSLDISSTNNLALGIGYKYNRYSLELRYQTSREIIDKYAAWSSKYEIASIIFGLSLF